MYSEYLSCWNKREKIHNKKKEQQKETQKTKKKQKQYAGYIVFITVRKNEVYSTNC